MNTRKSEQPFYIKDALLRVRFLNCKKLLIGDSELLEIICSLLFTYVLNNGDRLLNPSTSINFVESVVYNDLMIKSINVPVLEMIEQVVECYKP